MPSGKPDILMSVPDEQFAEQLTLTLLRNMTSAIQEVNTTLHDLHTSQLDVVQRLTRLEASPASALEIRIAVLEADRLREQGAYNLIKWMKDYTPWLLAIVLGGVAYFQKK